MNLTDIDKTVMQLILSFVTKIRELRF